MKTQDWFGLTVKKKQKQIEERKENPKRRELYDDLTKHPNKRNQTKQHLQCQATINPQSKSFNGNDRILARFDQFKLRQKKKIEAARNAKSNGSVS